MKKFFVKLIVLTIFLGGFVNHVEAQKKGRAATKRATTKKTVKTKTKAKINPATPKVDTVAVAAVKQEPAISDSLPIRDVKPSLRRDAAVDDDAIKDRTPLPYEHLRADDAVFRHKIWREIDIREKINLPFRYAADENNGNQRFISILLKAIQDSLVTVFDNVDDRFTTPMTKANVAKAMGIEPIPIKVVDSVGNETIVMRMRELNFDSIYKYHIKEEVIFDKESSRLFWRILGIAPVMNVINSQGISMGESELFWVYYPDMRPIFAKYEVYNGKNFGARMSWEELWESRMFYGRIIKSTMDNPYDLRIKDYKSLQDQPILQLLEGENIKEKIFNYEQDLWSY